VTNPVASVQVSMRRGGPRLSHEHSRVHAQVAKATRLGHDRHRAESDLQYSRASASCSPPAGMGTHRAVGAHSHASAGCTLGGHGRISRTLPRWSARAARAAPTCRAMDGSRAAQAAHLRSPRDVSPRARGDLARWMSRVSVLSPLKGPVWSVSGPLSLCPSAAAPQPSAERPGDRSRTHNP
jgi:hypothetical protein